MTILDRVEESLKDFRPKTNRQFVAYNIASRFQDLRNLARYLNLCDRYPKRVMLEAAKLAEDEAKRDSQINRIERFFELLAKLDGEERS